jgi:hypothetical protein
MKRAVLLLLAVAIMATGGAAQTRRGSTARRPPSPPKIEPAVRAAAERIAAQAKNLTLFLFRYGGVVKGIELSDERIARRGEKVSPELTERVQANKEAVVASIRNLQTGLKHMETDFQADPSLKYYYQRVNGLSDDVGLAADAADADKFDEAGTRLIEVVGVLLDALLPPQT